MLRLNFTPDFSLLLKTGLFLNQYECQNAPAKASACLLESFHQLLRATRSYL